jgi:dihydropteroate synthase
MQNQVKYQNVVKEVGEYFRGRMEGLKRAGIDRERVVLDVGIGFGKLAEHNLALLEGDWSELGRPLMWGLSRKSFLGVTEKEKGMKSREEALDWWNGELLRHEKPMVWRVHEPARARKFLS